MTQRIVAMLCPWRCLLGNEMRDPFNVGQAETRTTRRILEGWVGLWVGLIGYRERSDYGYGVWCVMRNVWCVFCVLQ